TYRLVVTNSIGTATFNAATLTTNTHALSLHDALPISNQTMTAGQTASFAITANGTAPLSYQWQKNGANINGATSASYTTPATTTDRKSTRLNSSHVEISYAVFCLKKTLTVSAAAVAPT